MSRVVSHRRAAATTRRAFAAQAGLSLIELMVALGIGAFLVLGVVTVFIANKDSSTLENSLARLQENGRFALDLIREDLHRSQYLGCNTGDVFLINLADDPNDPTFTQTLEGIRAYERNDSGAFGALPPVAGLPRDRVTNAASPVLGPDSPPGGGRNGSDVLTIRMNERLNEDDPNDPLLSALIVPGATDISIDDNPDCAIEQNSRVVVTGCSLTAHLIEVENAQVCNAGSPPNATTLEFTANPGGSIDTTYQLDSEVLLFEEAVWFVRDTGRDRNGIDVWGLYRQVNGGVPQEMIEGVEFMQVQFGQRVRLTDSIRYVNPSDPELSNGNNYEGVISVRIALLMQGFDLVRTGDDDRIYLLTDEQVVPPGTAPAGQGAVHGGGPVQRDVFTTTVNLRNAPEF